jgi:hypothetical protein
MSEEIHNLNLQNRVRDGDSAVSSAQLPHGGSTGAHSATPALGLGGMQRRNWTDDQAAKLPSVALPKNSVAPDSTVQIPDLGAHAESRTDDAEQT